METSTMQYYRIILITLIIQFSHTLIYTQVIDLDAIMSAHLKSAGLPGFSVALVDNNEVTFIKSYGVSDIENNIKLELATKQSIASISKTFIGIAIMQLVSQNKLELSTPINDILPFDVINPNHPSTHITIEQLASHSSGIVDYDIEADSWYLSSPLKLSKKQVNKETYKTFCHWDENQPHKLGEILKLSLVPTGQLYTKKRYSKAAPGKEYNYSNIGAGLAAYIVELISGQDYRTYIQKQIGTPIGIENLWLSDITKQPVRYFQNKLVVPDHHSNIYPAGGMFLSINELSTYFLEMIKGYKGNSSLLTSADFKLIMSPQATISNDKSYGYFWEINNGNIGHNGGNYGVITLMSFDPETNQGKIFMTNISSYQDNELLKNVIKIWKDLK